MRLAGLHGIVRNTGLTIGRWFLSVLLGLVLTVIVARLLGPEGNGLYHMAVWLPSLLNLLLGLGVGQANVYFVARGLSGPRTMLYSSLVIWAGLGIGGMALAAVVVWSAGEKLFPGVESTLLVWGLLAYPAALLSNYLRGILQGLEDFRGYNSILLVAPIINLCVVLILLLGFRMGVYAAVAAYTLGHIASVTAALIILRSKRLAVRAADASVPFSIRMSISYGSKVYLSNVLAFLNYRIDIFLLNLFTNPAAVGIYAVSVQITERGWFLSQGVSAVLLPRIAAMYDDDEVRRRLTPLVVRWVLVFSVLLCLIIGLASPIVVPLLFGKAFAGAITPIIILLPGVVFLSASKILANDVAARGRPELNMITAGAAMLINVTVNLVAIPKWGILGAAAATSISSMGHILVCTWQYSRVSGLKWYEPFEFGQDDAELLLTGVAHVKRKIERTRLLRKG